MNNYKKYLKLDLLSSVLAGVILLFIISLNLIQNSIELNHKKIFNSQTRVTYNQYLLSDVLDIQNGARGYILSDGNKEFWRPFENGLSAYNTHKKFLLASYSNRPSELSRIQTIDSYKNKYYNSMVVYVKEKNPRKYIPKITNEAVYFESWINSIRSEASILKDTENKNINLLLDRNKQLEILKGSVHLLFCFIIIVFTYKLGFKTLLSSESHRNIIDDLIVNQDCMELTGFHFISFNLNTNKVTTDNKLYKLLKLNNVQLNSKEDFIKLFGAQKEKVLLEQLINYVVTEQNEKELKLTSFSLTQKPINLKAYSEENTGNLYLVFNTQKTKEKTKNEFSSINRKPNKRPRNQGK